MSDKYRDPQIDELPDDALPLCEELPGDLPLLAELVGVRDALKVAELIGGTMLRLPSIKPFKMKWRNRWMRQKYDMGEITVAELARLTGLGERQTYNILGSVDDPSERQIRMW